MEVHVITYAHSLEGITPEQLGGFFEGWPNPPSRETFLRLLRNSDEVILALDESSEQVVGFVTAITDHVLSAYIPFVEVIGTYRGQGIGKHLVAQMLERLANLYMIDLLCDEALQGFYERLGMQRAQGMMIRHHEHQSGEPDSVAD
jgi:ribosomal protein S18 acetylase RimI-like enzyme